MKIFLDVETSSLKGQVIQLAAIREDGGEFEVKIKPTSYIYWDEKAEKVHGHTWTDCLFHTTQLEAVQNFLEFVGPNPATAVFHAPMQFDLVHIENLCRDVDMQWEFFKRFNKVRTCNTISMAKEKAAFYRFSSYKLNDVCAALGITLDKHHDALSDARACKRIYEVLSANHAQLSVMPTDRLL